MSNKSGVGGRCKVTVNEGCIDLSAFEYFTAEVDVSGLILFPLLYVEASILSAYCKSVDVQYT